MDALGKALRRVAARLARGRHEDDLREEIDAHLALRRQALIDDGRDPAEAEHEARRLFGNVTAIREETRDMWSFPRLESIVQDVRHGGRLLWRSPIFTIVAVASIAGGLVISTALFIFLNGLVFRPLGMGDGDGVYRIFTASARGSLYGGTSYPDFEAFRAAPVFSEACAITGAGANLTLNGASSLHQGEIVSPDCFAALRLAPHMGRFFDGGSVRASDAVPVVVSFSFWTRRLGSDPGVIGRPIGLNGLSGTIVAVAPATFVGTSFDHGTEFWAPVTVAPTVLPANALSARGSRIFRVFARLQDGVGRQQAEAALAVVASQLRRVDERAWTTDAGTTRPVTVLRETDARFINSPGAMAAIGLGLFGAAAAVVAIACVNLATMLLARGASRAREFSIRLAIGASRRRVLRQLVTESLLIALLGTAAAVAALLVGMRVFEAYRPAELPAFPLEIDWRVLLFAALTAVVAAVLFGLGPALHSVRLAIAEGLKGRLFAGRVRRVRVGARELLIVVQVTASVALLLLSTLFVSALGRSWSASPGFDTAGIAVVPVDLDVVGEKELPHINARILQAVETVPGVERVTAAGLVPLMYSSIGFDASDATQRRSAHGNLVSPGYFSTLRIPILAGREFDQRDRLAAPRVALVSETLARSMGGTTASLGRRLTIDGKPVEVVGVTADIRYRSLSEPFQPLVYLSTDQYPRRRLYVHARYEGGGETLRAIEDAVRAVDRRAAVDTAMPMRTYLEKATMGERATRWVGGAVGLVQLGLALLSLWGLVAYAVERRTQEMGVRLALGARPSQLVRLMMRPAIVLIAIGVVAGCFAGAIGAQIVLSESIGLEPLDLVSVAPVSILFTLVALFAAWWPARRAGLADPAASLRVE